MSGFRKVTLKRGRPRIGFMHRPYDHYMTVDGETAFRLGNGCETCHFFFERYEVGNVDSTVICDILPLSPHVDQMRKHLSKTLRTKPEQISIKATSMEGLTYSGGENGIAALASALLLPLANS